MKKIIAWILLVVMVLSTFAGCGCQKQQDPTEGATTTAPTVEADSSINDVIEYLKTIYKDDGAKTPVDYERFGIVRIAGVPYEVVWTADVSEDLIKIVVNDDGTVTIDVNEKCEKDTPYVLTATVTDENGNSVSHSWNYILPEAVDMVAIVKEAYALKPGESLPYESTLTGKIIAIGTPYDPEYKNITVTIEIEGAEDMPIVCYRLKGEGADELQIGDIITVTGTLTNYNGTIEFTAGCTLDAVIPGERVKAPDDPKEIVDAAYKLGANQSLPYEATLTGKITKITTPYSSQYNNITVVMVVEGRENKPITCYRMKGAGIDDLDVGDTITVKGYIINYVGSAGYSTIEFTAGCQLISYKNTGKDFNMPTSAKDIVMLAYSLKVDESLPEEATLTGVIRKVDTPYDSNYKNVTVTIVVDGMTDYPITCFRMKGDGADKIAKNDTITVKGILKNYKGTIEFDAGCQLLAYTKYVQQGPTVSFTPNTVTAPKVGTAYKLGVVQKAISGEPVYYFDGTVANSYYLGTSADGADAVDVMLKTANGGYYLTFGNGKYVNVTQETKEGKLYTNAQISTTASTVWTWDSTLNTLVTALNGESYYIGTYNTYTTLSISNLNQITGSNASKLDVSSFPSHLMTLTQVTGAASMEEGVKQLKLEYPNGYGEGYKLPTSVKVRDDVFTITWKVETETPAAVYIKDGALVFVRQADEVPYKLIATLTKGNETATVEWEYTVPRIPADVQIVTNPEEGKAYKLALTQENLGGSVLFLTGEKSGNFFATSDKSYEAVDVYAEKVSGGVRIYFMKNNVKTYVDMYEYTTDKVGVEFNTTLTDTSAVYKIDTNLNALIATFDLAGTTTTRYLGCYNNFDTMSSATVRSDGTIDGFPAMFVIVNKETPVTLNAAAEKVEEQLPAGPNTATDYTVPASVTLNNVKFNITWSVATSKPAAVKVANNAVDVTMQATGAVDYTLKAVIKNAATGESKEFSWNYTVPALSVSTIKQALDGAEDAFFIVKGVVTLVDDKNIYIQDSTGGICLYFAETPSGIALGDTVIGTGNRTDFYGLPELENATFEKTTGLTLSAKQTTYSALTNADLCTYVTLKDLTVTEVYDSNGTYTTPNITVTDAGGNSFQLYKAMIGKTGGSWDVAVGDKVDVTGAIGISYDKLVIRTTNASQIVVKALPATLDNAAERLQTLYPKGYGQDGTLPTTITVGETVFNVTWALQTDNAAAVKIEGGKVIETPQTEDVIYTLTATVSKDGQFKQVPFTNTVLKKPAVQGNKVVLQIVSDGKYVTDDVYVYNNTKRELIVSDNFADAVVLTVVDNGDGTVSFLTAAGKYLYTDGSNVDFTDTAAENTVFVLESTTNGINIKAPNVLYNGNPQYLEYYSGYVTVYGLNASKPELYEFKLVDASTPPAPTVPVAADAAAALKASITTLTNGMTLPTTYKYRETDFAVEWSVKETTNADAVKVEGNTLVLVPQTEDVTYTLKAVVSLDGDSAEATWSGTVPAETTPAPGGLTMIDKIADLTAGSYKMAAYLTKDSNNTDISAAPYHLWSGTASSGDLVTTSYAFANGALTVKSGETDNAVEMQLVAVEGKANTYYIMYNGQYVSSTAAENRKLVVGTTQAEWVATDNSNGGITLTTAVGTGSVSLGSASATSRFLRSYKSEATLKYGVVFFKEGSGGQTPPVTAPTLDQAEAALKEAYPKGFDTTTGALPTKVTVGTTEFTVSGWIIDPTSPAATISGGVLTETAQATDTSYNLSMVITDPADSSTKTVVFINTVPAASSGSNVITIAEALAMTDGISDIKVKGVVTMIEGKNVYVQDATGGICLYLSAAPTDLTLGDTVIGTGTRGAYIGMPQLGSATYEKSSGLTLSAKATTISALTNADLGTYVKLSGVEVTEVYDNNGAYTAPNVTVKDGDKTIQIYKAVVGKTDGTNWDVKVGDIVDVQAAVGTNNGTLQLRNTLATEITVATVTPPVSTPTAAEASNALKASITTLTNGMTLPTTYKYRETDFAVEWSVKETTNADAVKVEGNTLVLVPQTEDVTYTLQAKVSLGDSYNTVEWTGTVEKKTTGGGATNQYIKVTSADQFTTGSYVMVVNSGYAPSVYDSTGWLLAVQPTISGDVVTDTKNAVWTLTVDGSSVTIKDANGTFVKPKAGNNNGIQSGSYNWAWVFNNGTFKFEGTGSDTTTLASNKSSSNQFRAYKNTTISGNTAGYPCDFTLYKLDAE